jgi:hypothetical protein
MVSWLFKKKKAGYPILATMNLEYYYEITEFRVPQVTTILGLSVFTTSS